MYDFDLLVVGHETESVLAAVAAGRMGAKVALVHPPGRLLGGLLTEGGLSYVDRDSRHEYRAGSKTQDGLFGEFLARAGVDVVALAPEVGQATLAKMLAESQVAVLPGLWRDPKTRGDRLLALCVSAREVTARYFLDGSPDGDLLEALGERFAFGFCEHGMDRLLGISPLPRIKGVSADQIYDVARRLQADVSLEALRKRLFGDRRFLKIERGSDNLLVGPPHLALQFLRWREARGMMPKFPFEADGFNIAILGPQETSWNGLIYFCSDPDKVLRWSRQGCESLFREEAQVFQLWLRDGLGWEDATVTLPWGLYVRQTRHLLGTRRRLSLNDIAYNAPVRSVGTFAYYPDFRGFRVTPTGRPFVAQVAIDSAFPSRWRNVAITTRSAGYTPMAHSLCRLVQYNATLGSALGVAAALASRGPDNTAWSAVHESEIRMALSEKGLLADDQTDLEENPEIASRLQSDPMFVQDAALTKTLA